MYVIYKDPNGKHEDILVFDKTISVPFSESNTDYQNYLQWLEEGNEPEIINTGEV